MNNSNDTSNSTARPTLRLKVAPRQVEPPTRAPTPAQHTSKAMDKPSARWSDDYKERMQAEMNELASR